MTAVDVDVRPVAGRIGAEITGLDLAASLDAGTVRMIRDALLQHKVVFFRDQELDAHAHVRFGECFGEVTAAHPTVPASDEHPKVLNLNYKPGGARANSWHTDATFVDRPPLGSILRAVVLPPYGGDTVWANTQAAYEDMPVELRELADHLWAVHTNTSDYIVVEKARHERSRLSDFTSKSFRTLHPVVRIHPETGERVLLLGHFVREIQGFSGADSRAIFEMLQRHIERLENTVRWRWAPGDVAFWDNRTTQHYGIADFGDLRRHHQRITIAGERPVGIDGRTSVTLEGDSSAFTPVG